MRVHSHYENLKVSRDAPQSVIRAAYRALSQQYHPDRNPDDPRAERIMGLINRAYEVLSDPERRKAHDAWIQREEAELLRQHDESVRQDALERAARERRLSMPRRILLRPGGLAGLATVLALLAAVFAWDMGNADRATTATAAVRPR